ncbi:MAG: hypothetical protein IJG51_05550 [Synergistaceae bacterium]|nr:hypothetical protein [Synergistaceae bacterium]MBQ3398331.1 hypothetical protein [Synergistaceae bacterium]MBQ3759949.1 hypothetical protein [Synergistaceae bacterium]MBQ4402590.1 hypothetical protein [Synergistaceae bacterium]MBQ6982731.1 hypothetical protein [Synergistaceae bacterium]
MDEAERTRVLKVLDDFIEVREKHPWFVRDYLLDYADRVDYEARKKEARMKDIEKGQELKALEVVRNLRKEGITLEETIVKIAGIPVEVVRGL